MGTDNRFPLLPAISRGRKLTPYLGDGFGTAVCLCWPWVRFAVASLLAFTRPAFLRVWSEYRAATSEGMLQLPLARVIALRRRRAMRTRVWFLKYAAFISLCLKHPLATWLNNAAARRSYESDFVFSRALQPHMEALLVQQTALRETLSGIRRAERRTKRALADARRGALQWRRNVRLVTARCVYELEGMTITTLVICRRLLSRELVAQRSDMSDDSVAAYLNDVLFDRRLTEHVHLLRRDRPREGPWRHAASLVWELLSVVRMSMASRRGVSMSGEHLAQLMLRYMPDSLLPHLPEAALHASDPSNFRKKLLRRMTRRWALVYGSIPARAVVAPDMQRARVRLQRSASVPHSLHH